jgi:hypothetical protein
MKVSIAMVVGFVCTLAHPAAQSPQTATLSGILTIQTKNGTTAILGQSTDKEQDTFMFCIDQDRDNVRSVEHKGPGRVVYRPVPQDLPAGVTISGPEMVAPTLAVVTNDGKAWLFIGSGETSLLASNDPASGKAITVPVRGLRRTDWAPPKGPRRGTSLEGCLAPGGN